MTTTSTTTNLTLPSSTLASSREWRTRAACRPGSGVDPELFFPVATDTAGPVYDAQVAAAKAVCARCPVVAECLAEALAGIPDGIAGGLTEVERRALTRRPRRAVSAAEQPVSTERAAQRAGSAEAGGQAA